MLPAPQVNIVLKGLQIPFHVPPVLTIHPLVKELLLTAKLVMLVSIVRIRVSAQQQEIALQDSIVLVDRNHPLITFVPLVTDVQQLLPIR